MADLSFLAYSPFIYTIPDHFIDYNIAGCFKNFFFTQHICVVVYKCRIACFLDCLMTNSQLKFEKL